MSDSIRITLETLYDILRNEKKKEDLQPLEETFFLDVVSYLREKQALLETKETSDDMFALGERDKLEYELRSIRRILKEIYEKREKKIIDIALNMSRTGSDIIDTSSMLREEKAFYNKILNNLDHFRRGILQQLFRGELPLVEEERGSYSLPSRPLIEESESDEEESASSPEMDDDKTKVKFIHPTPSFIWKDMKTYGPFDAGEEIEIYPEVADLLVRKGRAEKVNSS